MTTTQSIKADNAMLDGVFGSGTPANWIVRFWLVSPTLQNTTPYFTGGAEVSTGGYVAQTQANSGGNWAAAALGVKSSGTVFTFPTVVAPGWGTVVACTLHDVLTNELYEAAFYGPSSGGFTLPSFTPLIGQTITVNAGDLSVTLT